MSTKSITAVFLIAGLLFFFVLGFVVGAIEEHKAMIRLEAKR